MLLFNNPDIPRDQRVVTTTNIKKFIQKDATNEQIAEIKTMLESEGMVFKTDSPSRNTIADKIVRTGAIKKKGKVLLKKETPLKTSQVSIVNRKDIESGQFELSFDTGDFDSPSKIVIPSATGFRSSKFGTKRRSKIDTTEESPPRFEPVIETKSRKFKKPKPQFPSSDVKLPTITDIKRESSNLGPSTPVSPQVKALYNSITEPKRSPKAQTVVSRFRGFSNSQKRQFVKLIQLEIDSTNINNLQKLRTFQGIPDKVKKTIKASKI
mgnify:CR=1 FL=1